MYLHCVLYHRLVPDTNEDVIGDRLDKAQAAFRQQIPVIRKERQDAVLAAYSAGWTKYKISARLGVAETTITAIINAAKKETDQ